MKKVACIFFAAVLLLLSGCKDISGSFKPGSFGKTPREKAMVEAIAEKYGDLTGTGEPQFLEARMTSRIEEFIPVDTVTEYSADAEKLYTWFVYDNFNKDDIEVEWIYTDDDYSIHTFTEKTGEDFGRGAFILERPDDGWALGNYKVIIRGRGLTETLTFKVTEGATVAVPLPFENGKITLEPKPGWYLTHWEYMESPSDTKETGPKANRVIGKTGNIWDYLEGTGGKNDFTIKSWRTFDDGSLVASGDSHTVWSDPPSYFSGTDRATFTVNREVASDWGINPLCATFDIPDHNSPTGVTSSAISFIAPDTKNYVQNFKGTMQMEKALQGRPDQKKAIMISMGNGYGFRYHYEWRE